MSFPRGHSQNPSRFSKTNDGFLPLSGIDGISPANPNDARIPIPPADMSPPSSTPTITNEKGNTSPSGADVIGRRRKFHRHDTDSGFDSDETTVTGVGQFYEKVKGFNTVLRYLIYVFPLAVVIAIPIVIGATAAPKARIAGVSLTWFFVWVEVVWLSLWVSKTISYFLPFFFQYLIGVVSAGTKKYALIIRNLEIPLSLVGWAITSLATFIPLMVQNPEAKSRAAAEVQSGKPATATVTSNWMSIVQQILGALVVSSLLFLAERVFIQMISINYHKRQMSLRVKVSKREVDLISLLYESSRSIFPAYCDDFYDEDVLIGGGAVSNSSTLKKGHKKMGSNSPMRMLQGVGRLGDKLTAALGNVASEISGKPVSNTTSAHSVIIDALEKDESAQALARRIWMSFVVENNSALYKVDIEEMLGASMAAEADECFAALDHDGNGDVSLEEMITTITKIGNERRSITSSLRDVGQAIGALDSLLLGVVFVICVFVFVAFLNSSISTTLATAGTALLSLSFVFAVTCQEILGSCIFLFVKHPYDVGDRVEVSKDGFFVERISLLYTEFRRSTNSTSVQVPNSILNTLWIENLTRSKPQNESIVLSIAFDTPLEDILLLKSEMESFVAHADNNRDFQPDVGTELTGVADMSHLELKVAFNYKSNWSNGVVKGIRRNKFMCALVAAIRQVPIYGPGGGGPGLGDIGNPSYSVAISPDDADVHKKSAKNDMALKRMDYVSPDAVTIESESPSIPTGPTGVTSSTDPNMGIGSTNWAARTSHLMPGKASDVLRRKSTTGMRRRSGVSILASDNSFTDPSPLGIPMTHLPREPYRSGSLQQRESLHGPISNIGNAFASRTTQYAPPPTQRPGGL